jgi:hypothetical protein
MLDHYGSVLCVACASSMRLATIEPGEAGTSMVMFECRYPPCAKSSVLVLGRSQLGKGVLSSRGRSTERRKQRRRVR